MYPNLISYCGKEKQLTFSIFHAKVTHFDAADYSLRKTVGKVSPILVTLASRSDSDFESSSVSFKENKPDGVNPNSNDIGYYVRKNEGKIQWFSADWLLPRSSWHPHFKSEFQLKVKRRVAL